MRGGGVDNVRENDNSVGYVNSGGDGCDFGQDNGVVRKNDSYCNDDDDNSGDDLVIVVMMMMMMAR